MSRHVSGALAWRGVRSGAVNASGSGRVRRAWECKCGNALTSSDSVLDQGQFFEFERLVYGATCDVLRKSRSQVKVKVRDCG